jgi:hypothetical protein
MKKLVLAAIVALAAIPAVLAEGNKEEATTAPVEATTPAEETSPEANKENK